MRKSALIGVSIAMLAGGASAQLAKLDTLINVDNVFEAFISTDPNVLGTSFSTGDNWQTTYSGSYTFNDAGTYYLHVRAADQGGPRMFIATMSLTDQLGLATFQNGGVKLLSNTTDWTVTPTLGSDEVAPISFGLNKNGGTWGVRQQQDPDAAFIWHPLDQQLSQVYFTTKITVVPTPGVLALAGLAPLGLRRSRR